MCGKCTNTYLYGANPEVEDVDVDDDDNDGDDDDDDLNSSFTILPPRNHDLSLLTQMKEEQSSNQPFRYKFSDDSEEDQLDNDDEADIYRPTKKVFNSTSKRVATKKAPKPKAMTKPLKRKRETSTKSKQTASSLPQDDNDEYNSAHLPAIFSDSIISQEKPKGSVPYKDGELSFSDDDDDGDLHIEHEKSKRTKQENDEDQPDQIINKYSIGGQRPKEYAKTKARSRRCVPLQQYSPFVRFNGDMRGTIARMNQEQLKNSEFPQRTLSRLVANAWNQMTKVRLSHTHTHIEMS